MDYIFTFFIILVCVYLEFLAVGSMCFEIVCGASPITMSVKETPKDRSPKNLRNN